MRLTEHFTLHEFRCRCGCGAEKKWVAEVLKTAEILEALRERINLDAALSGYRGYARNGDLRDFRIVIKSGVRCPKHNKKVGGAEASKHLSTNYQGAADTWVPGLPAKLWSETLDGFFRGRILYIKKNFVHVDRRVGSPYVAIDDPENTKEA